jgi:hypothetical protein
MGLCACGRSICCTSRERSRLRENSGLHQGIALAIPYVHQNQTPLQGPSIEPWLFPQPA